MHVQFMWIIYRQLRYIGDWDIYNSWIMSIMCRRFVNFEVHMYLNDYKTSTYDWHMIHESEVPQSPTYNSYMIHGTHVYPNRLLKVSHTLMCHARHTNELCRTFEWVMPQAWMDHVTHTNESCHTYEWVMSHMWSSRVTHRNESCVARARVVYHVMNESWYTYEGVMSIIRMDHGTQSN